MIKHRLSEIYFLDIRKKEIQEKNHTKRKPRDDNNFPSYMKKRKIFFHRHK
jgi:hypothetical protein